MGRQNNFNLIRYCAAVCVVVSHSYGFTGHYEPHPFGPRISLGGLAVYVFFAISGYLIYKSFTRNDLGSFAVARFRRIMPGLVVVSLLAAFVVGPLLTALPLREYFSSPATWAYVPRTLLLPSETVSLPGLFEGFAAPLTNGTLWTLHYEVFWYGIVLMFGVFGFRHFPVLLIVFVLSAIAAPLSWYIMFGLPFATGMTVAHYRVPLRWEIAAALTLAGFFNWEALFVALSYSAIWLGTKTTPVLRHFNRAGDYSYGVYIYGWPVQYALLSLMELTTAQLIAASVFLATVLGALSWHLVEKPALQAKRTADADKPVGGPVLVSAERPVNA